LVDPSNTIYQYDPIHCKVLPLFTLDIPEKIQDLTFDSGGNLYGLTIDGKLIEIDLNARTVSLIHSFLNLQAFTSICCDNSDIIYVTGSEGFVYSYNLGQQVEYYLGDLGYLPAGGLLVYQDFLLITLVNNQFIRASIHDLKNNRVFKYDLSKEIRSLFTAPALNGKCERNATFGISEDGTIVRWDSIGNVVTMICKLNSIFIGSASQYDFLPDQSLHIQSYEVYPSDCDTSNGKIIIHSANISGQCFYSPDGINFQEDSILTHLGAGRINVVIKDKNDCLDSTWITVTAKEAPKIDQVIIEQAGCPEKSKISVLAVATHGPMNFALDQGAYQPSPKFSPILFGPHKVFANDMNGCKDTFEFSLKNTLTFKIVKSIIRPVSCNKNNGIISIQVDQGRNLNYTLDGLASQTSAEFINVSRGAHQIQIMAEDGCIIDTTVWVGVIPCPVFIPNVFSPNQDGLNETFRAYPDTGEEILVKNYQILSRWGDLIYQAKNFNINTTEYWWDGSSRGQQYDSGVFLYQIDLEFSDKSNQSYQGTITLIR